jgi:hypothetical protein
MFVAVGDGLVTLKDDWAASQQLPTSIKRFHDTDESIYFVAAYHQLHCLVGPAYEVFNCDEITRLGNHSFSSLPLEGRYETHGTFCSRDALFGLTSPINDVPCR